MFYNRSTDEIPILIWKLEIMDNLWESRFCQVMLEDRFYWVDSEIEGKKNKHKLLTKPTK